MNTRYMKIFKFFLLYPSCVNINFGSTRVSICPYNEMNVKRYAGAGLKQKIIAKKFLVSTDEDAKTWFEGDWQTFKACITNNNSPTENKANRDIAASFFTTFTDIYNSKIVTPSIWFQLVMLGADNNILQPALEAIDCK